MTRIGLPQEAIDALADGKAVKIKSANLGSDGYNGTMVLMPAEDKFSATTDVVEVDP